MSVYEMSANELYMAYGNNATPEELLDQGRTVIAQRLMNEEGLTQEAAYYATDRILEIAQEAIDSRQQ